MPWQSTSRKPSIEGKKEGAAAFKKGRIATHTKSVTRAYHVIVSNFFILLEESKNRELVHQEAKGEQDFFE